MCNSSDPALMPRIVSQTREKYNRLCQKKRLSNPLKRGTFLWHEKAAHVGALQFQQLFFFTDSSRIPG